MATTQRAEIRFQGQRVFLRSSQLDPEHLEQVLRIVRQRLSDAESKCPTSPPHQVALLALLDLAQEYVQAKKRTLDFKKKLDEKSTRLLKVVEETLVKHS